MKRVGLIGCGTIGTAIMAAFPTLLLNNLDLVAVLVRPGRSKLPPEIGAAPLTTDIEAFMRTRPDYVIEAAGHDAVIAYGEAILSRSCEFHVLSVGALADDPVRERLLKCARSSGGRIVIPSGALAALDGLRSMREEGLESVKYTCTKPVSAWRSTAAEEEIDLDGLRAPQSIFRGSARAAAKAYPRNANLAAAVAFAGLGLDRTQVELIADPTALGTTARREARTANEILDLTFTRLGFRSNPKSSRITAMSAIAALASRSNAISFA